jgi:hypothetical protein
METQELFLHGLVTMIRGYVTSDTTCSNIDRILAARAVRRVGRNNAR